MSAYSESLKHPDWQRKRLEIFQRDEWKCRLCDATEKQLQVHHLCYAKSDWRGVPDKFLITVCCDCHDEIGGYKLPKNKSVSVESKKSSDELVITNLEMLKISKEWTVINKEYLQSSEEFHLNNEFFEVQQYVWDRLPMNKGNIVSVMTSKFKDFIYNKKISYDPFSLRCCIKEVIDFWEGCNYVYTINGIVSRCIEHETQTGFEC